MNINEFVIETAAVCVPQAGECPDCGFDDLWEIRVHQIDEEGVGSVALAKTVRCLRCEVERGSEEKR